MTDSENIITIYPDSKKSLSIIDKKFPITKEQNNIYNKCFLITFPNNFENLSIVNDNFIMCTHCYNYHAIFKIYKKNTPFPDRWLYYYNNDNYINCNHKVWIDVRYECYYCAIQNKNPNKLIFELL